MRNSRSASINNAFGSPLILKTVDLLGTDVKTARPASLGNVLTHKPLAPAAMAMHVVMASCASLGNASTWPRTISTVAQLETSAQITRLACQGCVLPLKGPRAAIRTAARASFVREHDASMFSTIRKIAARPEECVKAKERRALTGTACRRRLGDAATPCASPSSPVAMVRATTTLAM